MILIIDDDEAIRRTLEMCLDSFGYEHLSSPFGLEVSSIINQHKPKLILLDAFNSEKDLQEIIKNCKCKIIIMSTLNKTHKFIEGLQYDNFLQKPFELNELQKIISDTLN